MYSRNNRRFLICSNIIIHLNEVKRSTWNHIYQILSFFYLNCISFCETEHFQYLSKWQTKVRCIYTVFFCYVRCWAACSVVCQWMAWHLFMGYPLTNDDETTMSLVIFFKIFCLTLKEIKKKYFLLKNAWKILKYVQIYV